jgi:CBS domain containing-hemolysin-like protein
VLGSTHLDTLSDELDFEFESDDYDTIGGYCLERLEHMPQKNEVILTEDGVLLRIDKVDRNRIERVYVKLPETEEEAEE